MRKMYFIWCLGSLSIFQEEGYAQSGSDSWGWSDLGVHITLPGSQFSFDASYQYIVNDNASAYFLQFGTVGANYRLKNTNLQATGSYTFGEVNDFGFLHFPQLRLRQNFPKSKWHPFARFTYDRLMIDTYGEIPSFETNHRCRLQVGIVPGLNSFLSLIANTEHFIRRREGWAAEQRSVVGLDCKVNERFHTRVFYFNRWLNFEESDLRWNHAMIISLRFFVSAPHKINRLNKN